MTNKRNSVYRCLIRQLVLLHGGVIVGLVALLAVFCIPVESMQSHTYKSLPMLEKEFASYTIIESYLGSMTGTFTDCVMLGNAIYADKDHSLLERALYVYRLESSEGEGWAPGYSLRDFLEGKPGRELAYARYWHGYLVILKPLLWLADFNSIRMFAAILQFVLVGILIMKYAKRGENFLSVAFMVSMPFLYFFGLYASLSLSICFYILMAALLVQERWHEKLLEKGGYLEFFLLVGMATAYFDFLTYPLVTLGYPLCVALYLGNSGWKNSVRHLISYSAEWMVGYLGMWAYKWILTDVLTGGNIIADAINTIQYRTAAAQEKSPVFGYVFVLKRNLSVYVNWPFVLFILVIGFVLCFLLWKRRKDILNKGTLAQSIALALVVLLPFGWALIVQNHSYEHWMFTYKIFSISVFAGACTVGKLIRKK